MWDPRKYQELLRRLSDHGRYRSVSGMAKAFDLDPSTPVKWKNAATGRAPLAFTALLQAFAKKHGLDETALVERWEITPRAVDNADITARLTRIENLLERLILSFDQSRQGRLRPREAPPDESALGQR